MNNSNDDPPSSFHESVWEHAALGIVLIDAEDETILCVNPTGARLLGHAASYLAGQNWREVCLGGREAADEPAPLPCRERMLTGADGRLFPVVSFESETRFDGRPARMECFADISALRARAGQRLLDSHIAREASHSRSALLSRVSRDMRAPLAAIAGTAAAAGHLDDTGRLRQSLASIHLASSRVLRLLDDVLEMAQMESGTFVLETVPFNLENMLQRVCSQVAEPMEEKGIAFTVLFSGSTNMWFAGDEYRLSQIITNLLANACKFTPRGGNVTLAVNELRRGGASGFVQLRVSDTGIGMSPAQVDTLFTAFEEKDRFVPGRFGGEGFGLAVSRKILERMKGSITVTSAPGRGTDCIVTVELPRVPGRDADGELPVSGLRILVADPDDGSREVFAFLAAGGKNSVETAQTGAETLRKMQEAEDAGAPHDAVFIAHDLGDMTAVDVAENLDLVTVMRSVVLMAPVGRLSGIDTEAYGVGIDSFLPKPLFPSAIVTILKKLLGESGGEAEDRDQAGVPDLSHVTLLVVDDIARNRETFVSLLTGTNALVVPAENGLDAVEKFHAEPSRFKGIFMDLEMPGMDGFDAARTIRALPVGEAGKVPILAMTADVFSGDLERCLACGMDGHIAKPLARPELIKKILRFCM